MWFGTLVGVALGDGKAKGVAVGLAVLATFVVGTAMVGLGFGAEVGVAPPLAEGRIFGGTAAISASVVGVEPGKSMYAEEDESACTGTLATGAYVSTSERYV